jgi:hypothetical protein
MSIESEVYFDSQSNHKHSWGTPEIVIPHPKVKLPLEKLYEVVENVLNNHPFEMEELLQPFCLEGCVNVEYVEHRGDGYFRVFATEEVYPGRDYGFKVALDVSLDAEGIHVSVPEDTLVAFDQNGDQF